MSKIVSASLKEDLFGAGKYYLISKTKHQTDMWHVNGVIEGRLTTTYLSGADLRTLASRGLVKLVEQEEEPVERPAENLIELPADIGGEFLGSKVMTPKEFLYKPDVDETKPAEKTVDAARALIASLRHKTLDQIVDEINATQMDDDVPAPTLAQRVERLEKDVREINFGRMAKR